jgi:hypothetical protein
VKSTAHRIGNDKICHLLWLKRLSRPRAAAILSRKLSTLSRVALSLPVLLILLPLDATGVSNEETSGEVTTEFTDVIRLEFFTVGLFICLLLGDDRSASGFC